MLIRQGWENYSEEEQGGKVVIPVPVTHSLQVFQTKTGSTLTSPSRVHLQNEMILNVNMLSGWRDGGGWALFSDRGGKKKIIE